MDQLGLRDGVPLPVQGMVRVVEQGGAWAVRNNVVRWKVRESFE